MAGGSYSGAPFAAQHGFDAATPGKVHNAHKPGQKRSGLKHSSVKSRMSRKGHGR